MIRAVPRNIFVLLYDPILTSPGKYYCFGKSIHPAGNTTWRNDLLYCMRKKPVLMLLDIGSYLRIDSRPGNKPTAEQERDRVMLSNTGEPFSEEKPPDNLRHCQKTSVSTFSTRIQVGFGRWGGWTRSYYST